jgi:hypothetical protein
MDRDCFAGTFGITGADLPPALASRGKVLGQNRGVFEATETSE